MNGLLTTFLQRKAYLLYFCLGPLLVMFTAGKVPEAIVDSYKLGGATCDSLLTVCVNECNVLPVNSWFICVFS